MVSSSAVFVLLLTLSTHSQDHLVRGNDSRIQLANTKKKRSGKPGRALRGMEKNRELQNNGATVTYVGVCTGAECETDPPVAAPAAQEASVFGRKGKSKSKGVGLHTGSQQATVGVSKNKNNGFGPSPLEANVENSICPNGTMALYLPEDGYFVCRNVVDARTTNDDLFD